MSHGLRCKSDKLYVLCGQQGLGGGSPVKLGSNVDLHPMVKHQRNNFASHDSAFPQIHQLSLQKAAQSNVNLHSAVTDIPMLCPFSTHPARGEMVC